MSPDYSPAKDNLKIVHASSLPEHYNKTANKLKSAGGMQYYGTQFAKKEDRL